MSSTPGPRTPGEDRNPEVTVAGEVDSSGTNDALVGVVEGPTVEVKEIVVRSDDQAFDFNVELNGSDLFSAEQSPSSAEESFTPDQNTVALDAQTAELVVDVSAAGTDTSVYVLARVETSA